MTSAVETVTIGNMSKRQTKSPLTDALKQAVTDSGLPLLQVSKGSGIAYASLVRFMSGERSLRLDKADKLAVFFQMRLKTNLS